MDERVLKATKQWTLVQPVVSAFVGAIVRDFSARDDVLQETAVAILESYERYDDSRPFQAWALGIARNQVRLYLKRQNRELLTFDEQAIANIAEAFEDCSMYLRNLEHLQACLGKLDPKARNFLELRYAADLKPAAIARQVDLSANAVAKALQRIREVLRQCIQRHVAAETLP